MQGILRKRDHFWTITLFLVNGQEEPKKLRDMAWIFQPELSVQSPDGKPVFHSRPQQRDPGKSDPVTFAEEQEMAMLYRHHVEFGVGHGVSIHVDCPEGVCDRAFRLSTKVVPTYEVPRTTPPTVTDRPKLTGLVVDMKELGEATTAELDKKLRPLLTGYAEWIKEREADLKNPDMALYKQPGQSALDRCKTTLLRIQRATALVCACEVIRRGDEKKWGKEPFRIGLWVGNKVTPGTTDQAAEAIQQEHGGKYKGKGSGSPAQLTNCPWCGAKIQAGQHIKVETYTKGRCRTIMFCSDVLCRCPFSAKQSPLEGIPALVVDEEIYRRLPTLLIATVDKFAQMPWNGKVQMLFGQVESHCERHGFRSPEIDDADSHPKKGALPSAKNRIIECRELANSWSGLSRPAALWHEEWP